MHKLANLRRAVASLGARTSVGRKIASRSTCSGISNWCPAGFLNARFGIVSTRTNSKIRMGGGDSPGLVVPERGLPPLALQSSVDGHDASPATRLSYPQMEELYKRCSKRR